MRSILRLFTSRNYSWSHTNPKRKQGWEKVLPRLRFGLVCAHNVRVLLGHESSGRNAFSDGHRASEKSQNGKSCSVYSPADL